MTWVAAGGESSGTANILDICAGDGAAASALFVAAACQTWVTAGAVAGCMTSGAPWSTAGGSAGSVAPAAAACASDAVAGGAVRGAAGYDADVDVDVNADDFMRKYGRQFDECAC